VVPESAARKPAPAELRPPVVEARPAERRPAEPSVPSLVPSDPAIVVSAGANAEACRRVAVRLRQSLAARGARSVALVSAVRGEGKTTVLCDLAVALASLSGGRQIAVVDLDLRLPSIRSVLALPTRVGIEQYLVGRAHLDEVVVSIGEPALDVYPTVAPPPAPHELLVSSRLGTMLDELERRYSCVLVDTPPTLVVPDASLILQRVGACVVVARAGYSRVRYVKQLVASLPADRIVGHVLNAARLPRVAGSSSYYYGRGEAASRDEAPAGPRSIDVRRAL
jgi:non-specific protein-tyrosine kinase